MSEELFSSVWYRVSGLRPRVRGHARFHRHRYRGQLWYVLEDPTSSRCHRLTESAYQVIGLMDGERTTQQIWETIGARLGDDAPTQDETIRLLGMLHSANLLLSDVPPDTAEMLRRSQRRRSAETWGRVANPLALRLPLCDPDRFLTRTLPFVRPLFSRAGALAWLAIVGCAALLAVAHWGELSQDLSERLLAPQNLLLLGLVYPLVKALHELGHAYAVRAWGGEVHELGVLFLVLAPIPYCEASASTAFPEKLRRMAVGAAGMIVELFLAALALFVWLYAEPGLVRTIAYNVMWIGGFSTLVINFNPLLRFDGYYVLADALEIPNLAARSRQYLGWWVMQRVFGIGAARNPVTGPGEARWFAAYGIAAAIYRPFVTFGIALFLASQYAAVGAALALFGLVTQILIPLCKQVAFLFGSPRLAPRRARALGFSLGGATLLVLLLCALPFPLWTTAEGVVWPPEGSQVRAQADGFVVGVLARPQSLVHQGEPLIGTRDPSLEAQVAVLEARLRELQAQYQSQRGNELVQAQITSEEIASTEAALARARERIGDVTVRSPASGGFVPLSAEDLEGRFVHQGDLLGYVLGAAIDTVRVVIPESQVTLVQKRTELVELRLASRPSETLESRTLKTLPSATDRLPSRALGASGGGRLDVDPSDPEGLKTPEKIFTIDVQLPQSAQLTEVGTRVYVKFALGYEPLVARLYRSLRGLFLRQVHG